MAEENVLAVPRQLFDELGSFQGITFDVDRYLARFLQRENNTFLVRSRAEEDPSYKQIIPYVVLKKGEYLLHYVRGSKSGEKRLVAKGSVGIGGHINDSDEGLFSLDEAAYEAAVAREVSEELHVAPGWKDHRVALINDDSTEVGRVHLGVVHVFELTSSEVAPGEKAITRLEFLTPDELLERHETLETWSRIVVENWAEILKRLQAGHS